MTRKCESFFGAFAVEYSYFAIMIRWCRSFLTFIKKCGLWIVFVRIGGMCGFTNILSGDYCGGVDRLY